MEKEHVKEEVKEYSEAIFTLLCLYTIYLRRTGKQNELVHPFHLLLLFLFFKVDNK